MELVCKTCKRPFNAHSGEIASAAIDYTFGRKHTFICDNCKAENILTKAEYEAVKDAKPAKPVAVAPKPVAKPVASAPKPIAPVAKPVARPIPQAPAPKPVTPIPAPAPKSSEGVVLVASLHVRKGHSTTSETMAGLVKGEKVKIISTWTDGKNTWAQLGPDRWAAIEHNGKTMIEVAK
jgi:hypothetical protein